MTTRDEIAKLVADTVKEQMKRNGVGEAYLTPEQLCERWQVTTKALEKWRLEGKPPVYLKVQGTRCAVIRYPLHGENGVLDVERKWLRSSTTDTGESVAAIKPANC
jgi:hypothetical protein